MQKCQKWDLKSKRGYMVEYEPYSTRYLIWFPGSKRIEKACDMIFHEDTVALVTLILYKDEGLLKKINESIKLELQ
jgi:hypothetical protein